MIKRYIEVLRCIFIKGYREELQRREFEKEFLKYDCICQANTEGHMRVGGYCIKHKTDWL